MNPSKRKASSAFLLLGMTFLVLGFVTDQTTLSWIAIACVLTSLMLGGRWLRPRKK